MKRKVLLLLNLLLLLLASLWPMYVQAAELKPHDVAAIQRAVQIQIDALSKDDAAEAFAMTTSDARNRLGNPDNFLRMIKEQYDPVYRHRLALFSVPVVINDQIYLGVRLTDLESHVWVAIYLMDQESDGAWKIDGCQLVETTSISI